MKKNIKEYKIDPKKIGIVIICLIVLTIVGIVAYKKITPIYSVSDRTQSLYNKQNEDDTVIGWIRVQGINVDYPVVYSYTEKFMNDEYNYDYLWTNSDSLTLNSRTIIWGHNIRNVSSEPLINQKEFNGLENLPSFLYYDFVKKNKYIQYTINGKNYVYKIYAVSMLDSDNFSNNEYMTEEERETYIKKAKEDSYFNFDIDVDSKKELITLATCTRFFGETSTILRVDAVMVDDDEKLTNYKVEKNEKNYKKIEETMKGDVENESNEEA